MDALLPNGRRYEESARTTKYEEARDLLRLKEGDIAKGVPVSPKAGRLRFEDAMASVLNDYVINGRKSHDHTKRRIDLHLTPYFAGRQLTSITTEQIAAFTADRLKAGASAAEVNRELAIIKRAYSLAMKAGRIHSRPHVAMLAEHNTRKGFLEPTQFAAVKGHLPVALQPLLKGQLAEHERLKKTGRIVALVFPRRNGKRIRNVRKAWDTACVKAGYPGRLLHDMRRSAVRNPGA